jgi:hypothetical protein
VIATLRKALNYLRQDPSALGDHKGGGRAHSCARFSKFIHRFGRHQSFGGSLYGCGPREGLFGIRPHRIGDLLYQSFKTCIAPEFLLELGLFVCCQLVVFGHY